MLAVKHISLSGHEEIYLTARVSYEPLRNNETDNAGGNILWIEHADGSTHAFKGGTIFVMNEIGKTISRYDLGASMVPFGVDHQKGALSVMPAKHETHPAPMAS